MLPFVFQYLYWKWILTTAVLNKINLVKMRRNVVARYWSDKVFLSVTQSGDDISKIYMNNDNSNIYDSFL